MRTCKKCRETKPLSEFEVCNKERGWRRWECRSCTAKRVRAWTEKSKDRIRAYMRQWHVEHRDEAIARAAAWSAAHPERRRQISLAHYYRLQHEAMLAYGGYRCRCCGETEPMFLTIDHVNNDGARHREEIGSLGGARFYRWLRDRGFPLGFQVLCMNCNHGRHRNGGVCPHETSVLPISSRGDKQPGS
jgi:hypothetical protein